MKIISRGLIPEERVYRITCHHCHTVFEFKQNEGQVVYDQRDGNFVSILCPLCNTYLSKGI